LNPNLRLLKGFAARFVLPAIVLVTLSCYLYSFEVQSEKRTIGKHEASALSRERFHFDQLFNHVVSDLMVLRNDAGLSRMVQSAGLNQGEKLVGTFLSHCHYKPYYDQIRYIDENGKERVRVDRKGGRCTPVGEEKLQDKSRRYYFRETMRLARNDVYVSPFDLNVENGRVERPFKPMIRFATGVFDQNGNSHGIVVTNILGQQLIDGIIESAKGSQGTPMLINAAGSWLKGLKPADAWSFMFPGGEQKSFAHDYPEAWKRIGSQVEGQFSTANGLFTFTTIAPLQQDKRFQGDIAPPRQPNPALIMPENYYWKLVSFIPAGQLSDFPQKLKTRLIIANGAMLLVWGILSFMLAYAKEQERQARQAVAESDALTRDIVETAFDGIIMIDGDGLIRSFNPAASRMFGYSEGEVLGRNVAMLMPEPHHSQHDDYIQHYMRTLEPHILKKPRELEAVHKDGTVFPIELCVGGKDMDEHWRFTGIVRDITERKQMAGRLEEMAMTDGLTGVYNQAYFKRRFVEEFKRAMRYDLLLSLMILDIDFFKKINDTYGHLAGDQFLSEFSGRLQAQVREIDILARYGGEEFIILMPQTNLDGACIFAERLRHAIEQMEVPFDTQTLKATVSIGVAAFLPELDQDQQSLLRRADEALYRAKKGGRNRVVASRK